MPFGEELYVNVGGRTPSLKYGNSDDNIRQKFTGYQKDNETGLDFAEARMYENRHGRFTAVDPLLASGRSAMPQTFNRYVYLSNNPVLLSDPTGLDPWWKGNCTNDGRCSYKESKDKPTDGTWDLVDFKGSWYTTVSDWGAPDSGITRYLYRGGGQDDGWYVNQFVNLEIATMEYSKIDPKQVAVRNPELANGGGDVMWMGAAVLNKPSETYNFAAWGANKFGANLPYAPTISPDENTRPGGKFFYYGTNAAFLAQGGLSLVNSVRSGVSSFRAGGTTFGEQLFNSKTFGKSSTLFGNNQYGGVSGILNKPGSNFKAGWSGGRQEMNFINPRYANGLVLDAKTMGRSSFTGGGRQFRITFGQGSTPSQGGSHLFIPRTFVPDSIANPLRF